MAGERWHCSRTPKRQAEAGIVSEVSELQCSSRQRGRRQYKEVPGVQTGTIRAGAGSEAGRWKERHGSYGGRQHGGSKARWQEQAAGGRQAGGNPDLRLGIHLSQALR